MPVYDVQFLSPNGAKLEAVQVIAIDYREAEGLAADCVRNGIKGQSYVIKKAIINKQRIIPFVSAVKNGVLAFMVLRFWNTDEYDLMWWVRGAIFSFCAYEFIFDIRLALLASDEAVRR